MPKASFTDLPALFVGLEFLGLHRRPMLFLLPMILKIIIYYLPFLSLLTFYVDERQSAFFVVADK